MEQNVKQLWPMGKKILEQLWKTLKNCNRFVWDLSCHTFFLNFVFVAPGAGGRSFPNVLCRELSACVWILGCPRRLTHQVKCWIICASLCFKILNGRFPWKVRKNNKTVWMRLAITARHQKTLQCCRFCVPFFEHRASTSRGERARRRSKRCSARWNGRCNDTWGMDVTELLSQYCDFHSHGCIPK